MKTWYCSLLLVISLVAFAEIERCVLEPVLVKGATLKYPTPHGTTADLHTCHNGTVEMEFIVQKDGSVSNARVTNSTLVKGCRNQSAGEDFFHQVSIDAISQFQYLEQPESCVSSIKFTYANE